MSSGNCIPTKTFLRKLFFARAGFEDPDEDFFQSLNSVPQTKLLIIPAEESVETS